MSLGRKKVKSAVCWLCPLAGERSPGVHSRGPHRRSSPSLCVALVANAEIEAIRYSFHTVLDGYSLLFWVVVVVVSEDAPRLPCRCQKVFVALGCRVARLPACRTKGNIKRGKPNKTDYLSPRPHLSSKGQALLLTPSLIFKPPLFFVYLPQRCCSTLGISQPTLPRPKLTSLSSPGFFLARFHHA